MVWSICSLAITQCKRKCAPAQLHSAPKVDLFGSSIGPQLWEVGWSASLAGGMVALRERSVLLKWSDAMRYVPLQPSDCILTFHLLIE